jgi:hypothetical protein
MPGLRPHLEQGPETHLANVNIIGGTFVEPDGTTGKVKPCVAASAVCLGLAIGDAAAVAGAMAQTTDAWGRPTGGGLNPPNEVSVAYRGSWWLKNVSGATIPYGALIQTAANGGFAIAGATPAAGTIVAKCINPGGVVNNAEGRFRLLLG